MGLVLDGAVTPARVQIDLPDIPLFTLSVGRDQIYVSCGEILFESTDCTGQAWYGAGGMQTVWGKIGCTTDASSQNPLYYVGDPSDGPHAIVIRSTKYGGATGCVPGPDSVNSVFRATPVDLDAMFTPLFRVTTRERMQAQP